MGHKAFLDNAYRRFSEEQMRGFYLKGMTAVTVMIREEKLDIRQELAEQLLLISGFKREEVENMMVAEMSDEEIRQQVRQRLLGAMTNNGNNQRVILVSEVKEFITQGWEYVTQLPDGEAIVKLP